jgi:hypothetical protein
MIKGSVYLQNSYNLFNFSTQVALTLHLHIVEITYILTKFSYKSILAKNSILWLLSKHPHF